MNCAFHNDRVAVAQCIDCRRGLCEECTEKYTLPICDSCNDARFANDKINHEEEKKALRREALALFWKHAFWGLLAAIFVLVMFSVSLINDYKASDYDSMIDYLIDGFKGVSYTVMEEDPENPGEMISVEKEHSIWGVFPAMGLIFGFPFGWHAVNWFKRQRTVADEIDDAIMSATNEIYVFVSIIIFCFKLIIAMSFGWLLAIVYFIIMNVKLLMINKRK